MPADVGTMSEVDLRPYFYANETFAMAQSSSSAAQLRADVPALKGDLGAFAMPLPGDGVSMPVMTGWTYGIFTDDPERKAAAWKFIEFTLRPDNLGALNAAAGLLPTMVSIWDHEAYRDDPLMQQFRGIFDTAGMRERPAVPIYPVLSTSWAEQLADVVAGNITPAQAVDNARDATMREYERLTSR
jgi:ABC-type glycerol-3-phosphate transport system substrate-binding protein